MRVATVQQRALNSGVIAQIEPALRERAPSRIFMAAGEVSGDLQGAWLARALKARMPELRITGAGGPQMRAAGVALEAETTHLSSVGFLEPLRYAWATRKLFSKLRRFVRWEKPELAILIDNAGFNYALARYLRRLGIPVVYYFPPQAWVGSWFFAAAVARLTRLIISAFTDEAEIYRRHGARVVCLGHPLVDIIKPPQATDQSRPSAAPLVALMPGSRRQEIHALTGPMLGAARLILSRYPEARFILPLAAPHLRPLLEKARTEVGMTTHVEIVSNEVYGWVSRCSVILTTSGTSTLEAALLEVPMVVAYRLDPLSGWLGRMLNSTPYVALPNILLRKFAVPELMQGDATPERLAAAALEIIESPSRAEAMRSELRQIRTMLGPEGAIERVVSCIRGELDRIHETSMPQFTK